MVGVLRFRNSETGEWQDINAIKGVPGDDYVLTQEDREEIAGLVETEGFYTKAQIDERLENFTGGGGFEPDNASIILTDEETLSVSDEWLDGKLPTYSRGLNYNPDTNTLAVKASAPLSFNGAVLTLNEDNLFTTGSNYNIVNETWDEPLVPEGEIVVFDTGALINDEDIVAWFEKVSNEKAMVQAQVGSEMGWFGTQGMNTTAQVGVSGLDGVIYDYLLDFTSSLGPNTQANIGAIGFQVGYVNTNIYFIVQLNPEVDTPNFIGAKLIESNLELSFAHYFIRRGRQWRTNGNRIEINEDYINELIDAKIADLPVGDIPSGEEVEF